MSAIIEFLDVGYNEPAGIKLGGLSFSVSAGETAVVRCLSRDEESIFPKLCAGIIPPSYGIVKLFGAEIGRIDGEELQRLRSGKMGFVFSKPTLLSNMRAMDNVALPLRYHTALDEGVILEKVAGLFEAAGILPYADKFPPEMPAGIQKIVSVLRASVMSPEIIIYEDPVFELDCLAASPVVELIKTLGRKRKSASLIFTCQPEPAWNFADRVIKC